VSETADFTMQNLFCADVANHAASIRDGLAVLCTGDKSALETMQRSTHAIWGGARLLQLEPVARLAAEMKRCFSTLQEQPERQLNTCRPLFEAIDWLLSLSEQDGSAIADHVAIHAAALNTLSEDIEDLLGDAAQSSTVAETLAEAAPASTEPTALTPPSETSPASPMPETLTTEADDARPVEDTREAPAPSAPAATAPPATPAAALEIPEINADPALLDLFLTEVTSHSDVLNEGLLALENNPSAREPLEALMRSAHSIKGGARVVGLDLAVKLAHIMEDCFVDAQKGKLNFVSEHIDILLQAVDALSSLGKAAAANDKALLAQIVPNVLHLEQSLYAVHEGKAVPAAAPTPSGAPPAATASHATPVTAPDTEAVPKTPEPSALSAPKQATNTTPEAKPTVLKSSEVENDSSQSSSHSDPDRTVRVTANKIERLMGLAGEVTVSARWLPPFSDSLLTLKRAQMELTGYLEKLQDVMNEHDVDPAVFKELQKAREKNKESTSYLADRLNQLDVFTSTFATHADRLYREVIGVRMRPFADGAKGFPRMVRDVARQLGKKINFEIVGKSTEVDQDIQEKLDAPLNHLLRNAVDHGIESPRERRAAGKPETGTLRMEVSHRSGMLMITISDDGRGIDSEKLRDKILRKGLAGEDIVEQLNDTELLNFLFLPGFSTTSQVTEISGRGVGLDVVHSMVHEVGGVVRAESKYGQGMRFHLELPLTLSVIRTFLVEIAGEPYAFPLTRIDRCLMLNPDDISMVEDRQYFRFSNQNIALVNIHDVLELNSSPPQAEEISVVVVSDRFNSYGLVVDKFIGEYDLVVRPLDMRLGKVPDISAVAVMLDGSPVLIFDIEDLVHSIDKRMGARRLRKISEQEAVLQKSARKRILVVDDSITVREMERKLLEHHGYDVDVAVDGMDGWNAVRSDNYDLVVSDIDMPRMNGIELVKRIKQSDHLQQIPVIIVSYKDTEEHRMQGLEAGANYYLTKSSFEDESFVNAILDLIGDV
jgi:two-component system sensor histidine kinase and response regulator WspE